MIAAEDRTCRRCGCTEANCGACIARTGEPCHWVGEDLCSACIELRLPAEMTPAIAEVLGMPNFVCGPFAHGFRMAGADIKRRSEDEQAFVLWRLLHLAILHGDKWREFANADCKTAFDRAMANLAAKGETP